MSKEMREPIINPTDTPSVEASSIDSNVSELRIPNPTGSNIKSNNNGLSKHVELAKLGLSNFGDERKMAAAWVIFIAIYWSLVMWIPTLISLNFGTPGFSMYCIGVMALFAEGASIYSGRYPTGATDEAPQSHTGRGRFSAVLLVLCLIVDLLGLAYVVLTRDTMISEYFRAFGHFFSLWWCSLFFYNRLLKENSQLVWSLFWEQWVDIVITIIVVLILHNAYEDSDSSGSCLKSGLCSTYWVVVIIQLTGWILPMMIIEGWGTEKHGTRVALHMFVLDLFTSIPIIITVIATDGYEVSPVVFMDVLWKSFGFIRSCSYFMVYYVWLREKAYKVHHGHHA